MRRVLLAVAVLLTASVSPTFAGYIIIRVILEGGSGGGGDSSLVPSGPEMGGSLGPKPGVPMPGGPMGGPPGGSLGPPPGGGVPPMPGGGVPPMPGGTDTPGSAPTGPVDHTRSVVVVIPLDADFVKRPLEPKRPWNEQHNPSFYGASAPYYGQKLQAKVFVDNSTIQLYQELINQPGPKQTRATQMRDRYAQWTRGKTNPALLYEALTLALESGIIRDPMATKDGIPSPDAARIAQELLDVAAEKKLTLPDNVQRFVKAWGQMAPAVKALPSQPGDAETWQARLDAPNAHPDGHYAIIYWDSPSNEVTRRATQLNDNFIAFYLWHATRGTVLPVPDKPLTVVLAKQGQAIRPLHNALDGLSMQTDAFYAPDHNVVVLSPERLDDVGQTFLRQNQQVFVKGLSRNPLLAGQIPRLDPTGEKGSRPNDVARATTLALVEKLVTDEAELAAVSREGTRQLLFSSGVLPRHVTLPNWLTQGALNTFTRPRGPAYVTVGDEDKPFMTVAFSTGYGVPNYVLQRYFKDLDAHKELNADRVKLLENVLTDAYFAGIKAGDDPDPAPPRKKKPGAKGGNIGGGPFGPFGPPPMPGGPMTGGSLGPPPMPGGVGPLPGAPTVVSDEEDPAVSLRKKRERLNIKAQATAWALYYYLSRARTEELKQYIAELNKLPRDLPIDGKTAHAAFVRVFKLSATEDGPADPARMKQFARDWLDYLSTVPSVGFDIPLVVPEPPKNTGNGGGLIPPMPGGPGGSMGPRPGGP